MKGDMESSNEYESYSTSMIESYEIELNKDNYNRSKCIQLFSSNELTYTHLISKPPILVEEVVAIVPSVNLFPTHDASIARLC